MNQDENDPHGALFKEAQDALRDEDWVTAIRAFLAAVKEAPRHTESYLGLIRSYEAAAEEYGDPELLEQASKVCRDALGLSLDDRERVWVSAAGVRIAQKLEESDEESDDEPDEE